MNELKNKETTQEKVTNAEDVLKEYDAQTENDNLHFYHVDGYSYGDYSDSCCC